MNYISFLRKHCLQTMIPSLNELKWLKITYIQSLKSAQWTGVSISNNYCVHGHTYAKSQKRWASMKFCSTGQTLSLFWRAEREGSIAPPETSLRAASGFQRSRAAANEYRIHNPFWSAPPGKEGGSEQTHSKFWSWFFLLREMSRFSYKS